MYLRNPAGPDRQPENGGHRVLVYIFCLISGRIFGAGDSEMAISADFCFAFVFVEVSNWPMRWERLRRILEDAELDIIFLQEVHNSAFCSSWGGLGALYFHPLRAFRVWFGRLLDRRTYANPPTDPFGRFAA